MASTVDTKPTRSTSTAQPPVVTLPPARAAQEKPRGEPATDNDYVAQCIGAFSNLCRCGSNELDADNAAIVSHFHSIREPPITLLDYIRRIENETRCGEEGFFIALILIGRACNDRRAPKMLLPSVLTAHRLFLTALRVATKMHHDIHRSNRTFAKLGGVANQELNLLEWLFLERLGFDAMVQADELLWIKARVRLACSDGASPAASAHFLAVGMRLALPQMTSPSTELPIHDGASPEGSPPAGCGRAAAQRLRVTRRATSSTSSNPLANSQQQHALHNWDNTTSRTASSQRYSISGSLMSTSVNLTSEENLTSPPPPRRISTALVSP